MAQWVEDAGCEAWRPELKLHPQNTRDSVSTARWEKRRLAWKPQGQPASVCTSVAELARKTLYSKVEGENQFQNRVF